MQPVIDRENLNLHAKMLGGHFRALHSCLTVSYEGPRAVVLSLKHGLRTSGKAVESSRGSARQRKQRLPFRSPDDENVNASALPLRPSHFPLPFLPSPSVFHVPFSMCHEFHECRHESFFGSWKTERANEASEARTRSTFSRNFPSILRTVPSPGVCSMFPFWPGMFPRPGPLTSPE